MTTSSPDGESLDLPSELTHYIKSLNEPIEKYTPYFDALLIKRRHHSAFFQDLKAFRSQDHVIGLLKTKNSDTDIKELYRTVTHVFLESRFAHPWCRTTPGASKEGWSKAEWGSIKKQSEGKRKEEERLHKLLVPIWCGFRVRMMPTEEQLMKFREREQKMRRSIPVELERKQGMNKWADDSGTGSDQENQQRVADDLSEEDAKQTRRRAVSDIPTTRFNVEAFVSEEDDQVYEPHRDTDNDGAATAAKLFVGVAASSFLAKNPRVRKYLWKKLQK